MLEIRMRVGPKGQVVIPKVLRDAFKIGPGTEVTFSVEEEKIVMRATRRDTADVLDRIAKSGRTIRRFPPHAAYERELRIVLPDFAILSSTSAVSLRVARMTIFSSSTEKVTSVPGPILNASRSTFGITT